MMCQGCVNSIETGLRVTKGVKRAVADLDTGEVHITYDETKTKPEAIAEVIDGLGFSTQL